MQGFVSAVVNSVLFSVLGVVVFWVSFMALDKVTPYNLWKEICEQKNVALAIVVGAMSLGICTIIAAAIHG
jgi:uncharacterized membrane protein YjfL (UPF0719 family)